MNRMSALAACALALPCVAPAATRAYDVGPFEAVSVAAGVDADIVLGPTRSVSAEGDSDALAQVRIAVEGTVLRIERAPGSWFSNLFSWTRESPRIHVVTPALHSLSASSGAEVRVEGNLEGDFSVTASSGSATRIAGLSGGAVKAITSSGSHLDLAGRCTSLDARSSSGSAVDAGDLLCEKVSVHASSGSAISVAATSRVDGKASGGSAVRVRGRPAAVQVERSSGAGLTVRD